MMTTFVIRKLNSFLVNFTLITIIMVILNDSSIFVAILHDGKPKLDIIIDCKDV